MSLNEKIKIGWKKLVGTTLLALAGAGYVYLAGSNYHTQTRKIVEKVGYLYPEEIEWVARKDVDEDGFKDDYVLGLRNGFKLGFVRDCKGNYKLYSIK